jgi:hypothetical protein
MVSGRHHSKAVKLAATVLARLAGEQAASDAFGIDRRTIRGWVKHEDVPADSWAALDDLAGAQLLEKVARGQVTNATTLATVRGIASRNRRYAEVIARREARREEEQPTELEPSPVRVELDRLDGRRGRLMADMMRHELNEREVEDRHVPETGQVGDGIEAIRSMVDELLARTDEQVDAEIEEIKAQRIEREQRVDAQYAPVAPSEAVDEPMRLPTARAARPAPSPMLRGVGDGPNVWLSWIREEQ